MSHINESVYNHVNAFAGHEVTAKSAKAVIKGVAMAVALIAGTRYEVTEAYVERLVTSDTLKVHVNANVDETPIVGLIESVLMV